MSEPGSDLNEWTCIHGVTHGGTDDFISGVRNAHDELKVPYASLLSALSQLLTDVVGTLADYGDPEAEAFLRDVAVPRAREVLAKHEIPLRRGQGFNYLTGEVFGGKACRLGPTQGDTDA